MYSPQLSESLIPVLYHLRKARGIPMTKLVNELIVKALRAEELPSEIQMMLDGIAKKEQVA